MKRIVLLGALLSLAACQDVPQAQIDALQKNISEFETAGNIDAEMPAEWQALKEEFTEVLSGIETEKNKTFSNYSIAEQRMRSIGQTMDSLAGVMLDRAQQYESKYERYKEQAGIAILMWGQLRTSKDKAKMDVANQLKEAVPTTSTAWALLKELNQAENTVQKLEILDARLAEIERTNGKMKSALSEAEYNRCLEKAKELQNQTDNRYM